MSTHVQDDIFRASWCYFGPSLWSGNQSLWADKGRDESSARLNETP
jgi:hypothetical protein